MGVMMNPAETLATAPVVRLARCDSFGNDDEECSATLVESYSALAKKNNLGCESLWREASRIEK